MNRRVFLAGWLCLGGIGVAARAPRAGDLPRLAILSPDSPSGGVAPSRLFEALSDWGYADGRNIRLQSRFADNRLDLLPALAAELVAWQPDVIFTHTGAGAFAAAGATKSIPIVVGPAGEAALERLAGNFARPVANVTGFTLAGIGQDGKCLQLLQEAAAGMSHVGVLLNPDNPIWRDTPVDLTTASGQLGVVVVRLESRGAVDIDRVLGELTSRTIDGLLIVDDSTLLGDQEVRARVIEFTRERRLPSASTANDYARSGGLLSLGTDMGFIIRRAAEYVDRIIHGARPSELPVERPAKFRLSVNLATAKAIGLTIPLTILGRAVEVID